MRAGAVRRLPAAAITTIFIANLNGIALSFGDYVLIVLVAVLNSRDDLPLLDDTAAEEPDREKETVNA